MEYSHQPQSSLPRKFPGTHLMLGTQFTESKNLPQRGFKQRPLVQQASMLAITLQRLPF